MSRALIVLDAGPQVTVQDLGRPGYLSEGLSRGGAADRRAIAEGAALLGQPVDLAALELAGFGGQFEALSALRIALTGAPMPAKIGDRAVPWNASHPMASGEVLSIGAATRGVYGYLSVAGGIATTPVLGSRAAHLVAALGARLEAGAVLPVGVDPAPGGVPSTLAVPDRFGGGDVRILPGAQTGFFDRETVERFTATDFTRDVRGNRQGVRLAFDGPPFSATGQQTILSEVIVPGDIQMTGDGTPYVLLPECQTTGGFPRIGSVLPEDLPIVAQAAPGTRLRFRFVELDEARALHRPEADRFRSLRSEITPLVRDPHDMADLLAYQLIGGVVSGSEMEAPEEET